MKPRADRLDRRSVPSSTFTLEYGDTRCGDCYDELEAGDEGAFLDTDLVCWACWDDARTERANRAAPVAAGGDPDEIVSGDEQAAGHRNNFRLRRR